MLHKDTGSTRVGRFSYSYMVFPLQRLNPTAGANLEVRQAQMPH
jgi:hypothetical protein